MPNHVTNVITLKGTKTDVENALRFIKANNSEYDFNTIDFNTVIKMPDSLKIECSSTQMNGIKYWLYMLCPDTPETDEEHGKYDIMLYNELCDKLDDRYDFSISYNDIKNVDKKAKELGYTAIKNAIAYGHTDWYSWSRDKWGTKWNAYDFEKRKSNQIVFHTAWSPSYPVTKKLSELFPTLVITHEAADEFFYDVFPEGEFKNGELISQINYDGISAKQKWLDIHGYDTSIEEFENEYFSED